MKRLERIISIVSLIGFAGLMLTMSSAQASEFDKHPSEGRWEGLTRLYDPKTQEAVEGQVGHMNTVQTVQKDYYASQPMRYLSDALNDHKLTKEASPVVPKAFESEAPAVSPDDPRQVLFE